MRALKGLLARWVLRIEGWAWLIPGICAKLERSQGLESSLRILEQCSGEAAQTILEAHGAVVGNRVRIMRGLCLHVASPDWTNLSIGEGCHIGRQVFMDLAGPVRIGNRTTLSMRSMILTHFDPGDARVAIDIRSGPDAQVVIEDDVYLGAACVILPGVRIGSRSVVAAGAVVTHDVPTDDRVAGVPARSIAGMRG